MNLRKQIAVIIAVALTSSIAAMAYDDGDQQLWLKAGISGKLGNGIKLKVEQEQKYGDDMSEFYDEETLFAAEFKATDWMKVALGYRVVQERKNKTVVTPSTDDAGMVTYSNVGDGDHYWQNEERPFGDLVFSTKVGDWGLEERARFEWRMKDDGGDDYLRYRNRIKVKTPWKLTDAKINPYIAWEANYEDKNSLSGSDKWDRHRYYAGVSAKVSEHIKAGIYYCRQQDKKDGDWKDTDVAGIEVGAGF